jgi:hypothetical protein
MSNFKTITSANSVFSLMVPPIFSSPVSVMGYASDSAFANDAIVMGEVTMGVDGIMSAGFIPKEVKQKITLSPDSPSKTLFDQWFAAMSSAREVIYAQGTLILPATQEVYVFTKGMMTTYHGAPAGKKVLQPVEYEITWEKCQKSGM